MVFVLENEMHEIVRNLLIEMDHPNLARRPNLALINKKKELVLCIWPFIPTAVEIFESKKIQQIPRPSQKAEKNCKT